MDEVDVWVEEQAGLRRAGKRKFLREMESEWTPARCFRGCCAQFLADGNNQFDEFQDEYSFRNGCAFGKKCRYAHPCVTISFVAGVATVTLSRAFDKFTKACLEADAWPHSEREYRSEGTVRELRTRLQNKLARHLVKVAPGALEATDAKYAADQQARCTTTPEAPRRPFVRFGEVATAVALRCDLLSLYHLRQVSIDARNAARAAAKLRLRRATFRVHPLVDGTCWSDTGPLEGDSEVESIGEVVGFGGAAYETVTSYDRTERIPLAFRRSTSTGAGVFAPAESNDALFHWQSQTFSWFRNVPEGDYVGQQLKVFWLPAPEDGVAPPSRFDVDERRLPDLGILVAKIRLGVLPETGTQSRVDRGVAVRYEVVEACEDQDEERDVYSCRGRARVLDIALDFGTLVAHAATDANPDVRNIIDGFRQAQRERPLLPEETAFMRSVDQAAATVLP